ncbi:hypothetical protein HK098_003989 [Nowakowskiella sp. JEL0407]|nr:hypothetical protein HK098_003989 [Nowakowskiella sp. JEL0407]
MEDTNVTKGILKKKQKLHSSNTNITWDEENLELNEAQKSPKMKITEPKTPFIHYNIDNDEVLGYSSEIPPLELSQLRSSPHPASPLFSPTDKTSTNLPHHAQFQSLDSWHSMKNIAEEDSAQGSGYSAEKVVGKSIKLLDTKATSSNSSDNGKSSESNSVIKSREWESEDEDDASEREKQLKHEKFEKMRAMHYNMKTVLTKRDFDDEEDEDENGTGGRGEEFDEDDDDDYYEEDDVEEPETGKEGKAHKMDES